MQNILHHDGVLMALCTFSPAACVKLRKLGRGVADCLSEERLEWLLPQLFEALDLYNKKPFELCQAGELDQLWLMIVHGLNLKARDPEGGTLLQSAIRAPPGRARKLVTMLLERGASVNAKGSFGYTVLHEISYTNKFELAEYLLSRGANVDALSQNGSTPILIAAREGQGEMVRLLLRFGADPDDGGDKGWAPLFIAAAEGHSEVVSDLVDFGADVTLKLYVSYFSEISEVFRKEGLRCTKLWTREMQASAECSWQPERRSRLRIMPG